MSENINTEQQHQQDQQHMQFPGLDIMQGGQLTQEQALALHQFHAMQAGVLPVMPATQTFPRPTVKRRKPVKWEHWEEKNLIEGVCRFGRGNWAQIRAAFEFNPCRTNVDLHDKWRVLTGERKRNRNRGGANDQAAAAIANQQATATVIHHEIQAEGHAAQQNQQKVQLIPVQGANGLYTLSSFLPAGIGFDGQHVQFPAEFLQGLGNGELLGQGINEHEALAPITANIPEDGDLSQQIRKRTKKSGDEDEVAQELLKLGSKTDDEQQLPAINTLPALVFPEQPQQAIDEKKKAKGRKRKADEEHPIQ